MPETEYAYTVTGAEMQLLEWLRGTNERVFTLSICGAPNNWQVEMFAPDCRVLRNDQGEEGGSDQGGTGKTFEEAWAAACNAAGSSPSGGLH